MKLSTVCLALLGLASPALSTVYITSPVATTSADGGKRLSIQWQDNGKSPKNKAWGGYNIWLAAGSESAQFKLDQVASNLDTDKEKITYKVPKDIGPKGKYYFIRMESTKQAANGTADFMAFSARFELDNVTGQFNSTVMAAAQGKEGAVPGAASSSAAAGASSTAATGASGFSTSALGAAASPTSSAASASKSGSSTSGAGFSGQVNLAAIAGMGAVAAGAVVLL